jgi:hypothetical protein
MVGDLADIVARLRGALPARWFADDSPNLVGLLNGIGTGWVWLYDRVKYVARQTRLLTATEDWLDLIANDYFGSTLVRKPAEADGAFRTRIQQALLCEAATRGAVSGGLKTLTGTTPVIFEPGRCGDTGGYGSLTRAASSLAYGLAGGWGNLELPYQFFVTVQRPPASGASGVAGYGDPAGGFGKGAASYVDLDNMPGQVADQDIEAALCRLMPVNAIAWLRII